MAGSGRHVNLWESNLIGGFEHLIGGVEIRCFFFHQKPMVKRGDQIRISAEFISWGLLAEPIHKLTTPLFWICLVIWKAKMISAKYPLSLSIYVYIPIPKITLQ